MAEFPHLEEIRKLYNVEQLCEEAEKFQRNDGDHDPMDLAMWKCKFANN